MYSIRKIGNVCHAQDSAFIYKILNQKIVAVCIITLGLTTNHVMFTPRICFNFVKFKIQIILIPF